MIDIVNQINAAHREIGNHPVATGAGRSLLLRRTYDATIADVWSACTDPDRIARWLAPIEGDLRLGAAIRIFQDCIVKDCIAQDCISQDDGDSLLMWGPDTKMRTVDRADLCPNG